MSQIIDELKTDVRFVEGLVSCINCGTCTAICPAAQFYDYDPRRITDILQNGHDDEIIELLKSDTIWYCGECLSCKTRCPRGNTPGYIVQALRNYAQEKGYYRDSARGRQQLTIKRTVGDNILKYGYCVYIDEIDNEGHPEQGPVWKWFRNNAGSIMQRLGANYKGQGAGTLRKINENNLEDLRKIFKETGALERFEQIEKESNE